jgi:sugar phosphate isomerase/epimerase
MNHPNRRSFCKSAGILPFAAAAGLPLTSTTPDKPPIKRVGGSHLKLSLNAFSFNALLRANAEDPNKGLDLFGLCEFCAKHDFDSVDLTGYYFPGYPNAPEDSYLFKLKRHAFDLGLEISGTGVRNDFATADKAVRAEGVQLLKTWIEVAAKLGAPVVRAFAQTFSPLHTWKKASGGADRDTVEGWIADALRECAEHGQKFGVIVGVQNHGDFVKTAQEHLSLINRVDHDWCGVLVDTGKYKTDDPYADIAVTAPHAVNWQVKQALGSGRDAPPMDMLKLMTIIRKSGYRGNLPIETLPLKRPDYDPFTEVPKILKQVREAMKATEENEPDGRESQQ